MTSQFKLKNELNESIRHSTNHLLISNFDKSSLKFLFLFLNYYFFNQIITQINKYLSKMKNKNLYSYTFQIKFFIFFNFLTKIINPDKQYKTQLSPYFWPRENARDPPTIKNQTTLSDQADTPLHLDRPCVTSVIQMTPSGR